MDKNTSIYEVLKDHINEIKTAIYSAFVFLHIDTEVVKVLLFLMLFDTIFGIVKSIVMGVKFDFKVLLGGIINKTLTLLIPMTLALVGQGLKKYDFTPLVDMVLRILVVAEGFSILTSFYVIKTKKEVENFDIITLLLAALRQNVMKLLKAWLGKIDTPNNEDSPENTQ